MRNVISIDRSEPVSPLDGNKNGGVLGGLRRRFNSLACAAMVFWGGAGASGCCRVETDSGAVGLRIGVDGDGLVLNPYVDSAEEMARDAEAEQERQEYDACVDKAQAAYDDTMDGGWFGFALDPADTNDQAEIAKAESALNEAKKKCGEDQDQ